jgi:hypothetical protein
LDLNIFFSGSGTTATPSTSKSNNQPSNLKQEFKLVQYKALINLKTNKAYYNFCKEF